MDAGGELRARLVRPPAVRSARLLRPPRRGAAALVRASISAACALPVPWALLGCARALRAAGRVGPVLVLMSAFRRALEASGDPLGALIAALGDRTARLSGIGLFAATWFVAALFEGVGAAIGLPALRARIAPDDAGKPHPLVRRLADLALLAVWLVLAAIVWAAATLPLVVVALRTWTDARAAGAGAALLASAALALVAILALAGALLLRLIAEAAVARVGAFGDRPLAALFEGAALVLRRPLVFLGALYLLMIAALLVGAAFGLPAALLPAGGAGLLGRALAELPLAFALGLLALARLSVFVAAALDDRAARRVAPEGR